jgi:hypothetical protein
VSNRYLATYLNDHLAGSTVGVELARRAASENEGSELGAFLSALAREIEEDRETLKAMMASLGVGEDRKKVAVAWVGEKLGRFKPNGQFLGYSPLSPLVELEGLSLGIEGKLAMWQALLKVADRHGLDEAQLEELARRAERQRAGVESHRLAVAARALTA